MSKMRIVFTRIVSMIMLICSLPMMWWCLNLIDNAALEYTYGGAGCFAAAMLYIFSIVTAIAGLRCARKSCKYSWCRTFGYIQLIAGVLLLLPLQFYVAITTPPLVLLTALYLFCVGWRGKWTVSEV